jgi:hypothetical protein
MNPLKNKHWIGIRREPEEEEDGSKPRKGPFWRNQENAAKHGARLRDWRAADSDGDASQMPCVPNATIGYTPTINNNNCAYVSDCYQKLFGKKRAMFVK